MCYFDWKNKVFHVYCVIDKQYCEHRHRRPPPPQLFVPTQQFKLQRFCFFGQDDHLWESKLRVTLQVRPGWDTSGGSEISEGPTSKGRRGDRLSQESCPLTSGLHCWPRRWCLKIRDSFPFYLLSKNQDSNLMLPLLSPWRWHQQSKPITTQTPPPQMLLRQLWLRRQGWLNFFFFLSIFNKNKTSWGKNI